MDFQRARTAEQIDARQSEIISAAEDIYEKDGFDAVHFKAISERTSFSRPTIYHYYQTKEEVLLDVLKREFLMWQEALAEQSETKGEISPIIVRSLKGKEKFLRLLATDYTRIEVGSSVEKLTAYKQAVQPVYRTINEVIGRKYPDAEEQAKDTFALAVLSLMGGLFPMIALSEKQREALQSAAPDISLPDFYECLGRLLSVQEAALKV